MSGTNALGKGSETDPPEDSKPRKPAIVVVGARDRADQAAEKKRNPRGGGEENRRHPRLHWWSKPRWEPRADSREGI